MIYLYNLSTWSNIIFSIKKKKNHEQVNRGIDVYLPFEGN